MSNRLTLPPAPFKTACAAPVSHSIVRPNLGYRSATPRAIKPNFKEEPALAVPADSFVSPQTGKVRKKMKKKKKKNVAEGEEEALALEDAAPTPSPRKKKKKKKKVVEEEEEEEELDPNDGGKE